MAVQDFISQLQDAMRQQQGGAKKRAKAVRKPVSAVKPKAKPAHLVNKQRLFHNKLMKHFGGFFESVDPSPSSNGNSSSHSDDDKKKHMSSQTTRENMSGMSTETAKQMATMMSTSVLPKVGGAKKRVVRAAPKKRRVGVRARTFRGGYEEDGEEEFMSMDAFSQAQEESQSGGRKKRNSVARRPAARRPAARRPAARSPVARR
jgi:hypothetical protein